MPADAHDVLPAVHPRRVLFLNGNATTRPYRVAPLGLAFVASATERAGHDVRFTDYPFTAGQRRRFHRELSRWRPDYLAVGIRNLDNSDFHSLETYLAGPARLIGDARRIHPGLKVIVGGPAGTVEPTTVVSRTRCDHLILGEGEESLPDLIARLENGESMPPIVGAGGTTAPLRGEIHPEGVAAPPTAPIQETRHAVPPNAQPFRVADAAALPAPQLHRWVKNLRPYLCGDAGYPVQTKRGCPLKCTYCTYARIEGVRYRFLNPAAVADEIEGALARGVRDFEFVDSTFNLPPTHALEILGEIRRRRLFANYVGTGLNPSRLPEALLEMMRSVGFRSAILTAESASNTMLASYRKNYSQDRLHEAAERLRRHDIRALWVFLLGGPGETKSTVGETLAFIEETIRPPDAVYITSGIRVYPGSGIDDDLNSGRYLAANWRRRPDAPDIPFFYSAATPPEWLEARLRGFQGSHPHVMLSCEGHAASTQLALRLMRFLPFRKPYWQYIPMLNHARRWLQPAPPPRPREAAPELEPASASSAPPCSCT